MQHLFARQLAEWLVDESRPKPVLLDVREPEEFEFCHIPGSRLIPMQEIPARCEDLSPDDTFVVICHHGRRSLQVALFLEERGFSALYNLTGGVDAWAGEVDPGMRRY